MAIGLATAAALGGLSAAGGLAGPLAQMFGGSQGPDRDEVMRQYLLRTMPQMSSGNRLPAGAYPSVYAGSPGAYTPQPQQDLRQQAALSLLQGLPQAGQQGLSAFTLARLAGGLV